MIKPTALLLALLAISLAACNSWKPTHSISTEFSSDEVVSPRMNLLVVGTYADADFRREAEESFVAEMRRRGVAASAGHPVVADLGTLEDDAAVRSALEPGGYDGVLTVTTTSEGPEYDAAYWEQRSLLSLLVSFASIHTSVHQERAFRDSNSFTLEVELWDADSLERLWGATTDSFSAEELDEQAATFASFMADRLRERDLVATGGTMTMADVVYRNGRIYTVDDGRLWAEAIAIKGGRFLAVGSNDDIARVTGPDTIVHDLEGRMVLPGLHDHHCHPMLDGYMRSNCDLPGTLLEPTFDDTVAAIRAGKAAMKPGATWFISSGHTQAGWPSEQYNRQFLDTIFPDVPAYLEDETGHNALVNTRALEIAGITKDTPDPPGGEFEKDADGELTGHMIEFGAINIFKYEHLPQPTVATRAAGLTWAIELFNSYGYTAFADADAYLDYPEVYARVIANGDMTIHPTLYMHGIGFDGPTGIVTSASIMEAFEAHELPDVGVGVKVFSDGSIEGRTAALVDPYVGEDDDEPHQHAGVRIDGPEAPPDADAGYRGELTLPYDVMLETMRDYDAAGLQIKTHAVGDRAVRRVLDMYETMIETRGGNHLRHQIDHLNLVHPDDLDRFSELDVIAGPYPSIAHPNSYQTAVVRPFLGDERWYDNTLPLKGLLDAGARVAFKSDWASIPMWPFYGMQCAVTRRSPGSERTDALNAHEAISLADAIRGYTINGAYALRREHQTGSIEAGKSADFCILDRNLFNVPASELHKTQVLATVFRGDVVYSANEETASVPQPTMQQYLAWAATAEGCPAGCRH
ncbi:MAG: amidohydrolase [Planctomycetota bacterium]|jgi:predicted amidohydrolase YtcJ